MHLKKLLSLSLIATSLLTVTACNKREVVPVEVLTTETVVETVKLAEPIVVSVEHINEVKEDEIDVEGLTAYPADPDIDYYSKDMDEQQKKSYSNSGSPAVDNPSVLPSVPEDHLTAEAEALYGGLRDWGEVYESDGSIFR